MKVRISPLTKALIKTEKGSKKLAELMLHGKPLYVRKDNKVYKITRRK